MTTQQNDATMNWVDYCDSLSEESFRLLAQSQSFGRTAELFPEPYTMMISRLEAARELV